MNLAVDIGNTFIKAGFFENEKLLEVFYHLQSEDLIELIAQKSPEKIIISSVSKKREDLPLIFPVTTSIVWLDYKTPLPFQHNYKTPETLGMDRIAASAGAIMMFPGSDRLVIDSGTCITYEFVSKKDIYEGGAIAPGIDMRFKSLNTFTSKLPLVSRAEKVHLVGKNTEESIQTGVLKGILAETEGIIRDFKSNYPEIKIILCGGDSSFFETNLKETIFAVPELVLVGLNSILLHNASIH